ncbi:Lrp/AsnC family transcriptional regulator [Dyella caseinilytica]|uniref:Lrp/AsnC family transcriptional regulator n=1 Tax=Dyella caseinilytica TaxID=1849581 RepID=A0ABX7GWB2_9GAMM|nr:Lrp/AsnC family transcriptional regulator [Dyella caseinilytica]QRN54773.1 Lrp/AsnC family transcriptional regulator [Dyella caseinilytica]GFZ96738.1 AsnC family transcriptional regulator [Dyella caseinilytica]
MAAEIDLDRTDFAILRLLMKDAWLSNKQIAAAVGLAPSSCHERIKSLRARGVLLGAHAEVNLQAIGFALEAVLFVQLGKLEIEVVDNFVSATAAVPEVRGVFLVSGRADLVVDVVVHDMEHLKAIISQHFNRHAVVQRVETSVVFNRKQQYGMPLASSDM